MERMPQRAEGLAARLRYSVLGVAAAAAIVVGACAAPGGGAATAETGDGDPTSGPTELTLELMQHDTLGSYVVGMDGKSLYIFTLDTGSSSSCNGECAVNWPPLTADSAADVDAGEGVAGALGTITRDDGSLQITLGGKPLYYFKGDPADGDTNGQGLNDVWYLAAPDGTGLGIGGAAATDGPEATPCPPADRSCY